MAEGYADFTFRGDCGHEIKVPLAGKNLDTDVGYTCPVCGDAGVLKEEHIAGIKEALKNAKAEFVATAQAQLDAAMREIAGRHKGVTYRPKR